MRLIERGVYAPGFRHPDADRVFVHEALAPLVAQLPPGLAILEVGCGVGEWLQLIGEMLRDAGRPVRDRFGFDLTPELISLAREYLDGDIPADHLKVGDLLAPDSYRFAAGEPFGLVFAYDVVQQLPPKLQASAARTLFDHVLPGCTLVIFDQDAESPAGRRMAVKKAITRWTGIPLVPRFYLVARYPRVSQITRTLRSMGAEVEVRPAMTGARVAIVVRRVA